MPIIHIQLAVLHTAVDSCHLSRVSQNLGQLGQAVNDSMLPSLCYMWQSRVEIEHYSVAYFDRIAAFEAL